MIYTTSLFGFDSPLVKVETLINDGIKSIDVIGVADYAVKELCNVVTNNLSVELQDKRIVICFSPCDLEKENGKEELSLPLMLSLEKENGKKIFAYGKCDINGVLSESIGLFAALCTAIDNKIKYAIIPYSTKSEPIPSGIKVYIVKTLEEARKIYANLNKE